MISTPLGKLPSIDDARWFQVTFLLCFVCYAILTPGFSRAPSQYLVTFLTCVVLDYLFIRYYKKSDVFPLSGLITSIGAFLLCDSPSLWLYFYVAAVSILSKNLIQINGRHIFNPNNLGLVTALLFFEDHMTIVANTWEGNTIMASSIFMLGCLVVYRANRIVLTFTFLASFTVCAFVRSQISGLPFLIEFAPITGPASMLFIFYMITDPATTPASRRDQIIFGIVLGILDALFRYHALKNAPFYSLFLLCGIYWTIYQPHIKNPRKIPASS